MEVGAGDAAGMVAGGFEGPTLWWFCVVFTIFPELSKLGWEEGDDVKS